MSKNGQADPSGNKKKKKPKMRHTKDKKRIAHENTKEKSRLEHGETIGGENILRRVGKDIIVAAGLPENESIGGEPAIKPAGDESDKKTDHQAGEDFQSDGENNDHNGRLAGILTAVDRIMPDDRDNVASQAVKHDALETPAAILGAIDEINKMRKKGNRLFFENKDKNDGPISSGTNGSDAAPSNTEKNAETETGKTLDVPEPILSLPLGAKAAINSRPLHESGENAANARLPPGGEAIAETLEKRGYYEILGIGENADENEIKNAYRALAKKYHPDVNVGNRDAEMKFKEANEAYSVLGDPEKRKAYGQKPYAKKRAENDAGTKIAQTAEKNSTAGEIDADAKNEKNFSSGKKKDRFARRALDKGFVLTQAAAHLMPDEQQDENSGTAGIRKMISEGAKIARVIATAEKKPSKLQHEEDGEFLTDGNTPENNSLESAGENVLRIDRPTGEDAHESNLLEEAKNIGNERNTTKNDSMISNGGDTGNSAISGVSRPKSKKEAKIENGIDHKIDKYTAEAEKLEKKIEKAEKKIPKKKIKKIRLAHGEHGRTKRQISFADEKIEKADAKWNREQSRTLSANAGRYAAGNASAFVHGKISESENLAGNTGLKAAHTAQKGLAKTCAAARGVHRHIKNAPYRSLQHLKAREARNRGKLAYQQLLKDNPELRGKSVSRMFQKRRIKKEYAKAFRAAQSGDSKMSAFGTLGAAVGIGAAAASGNGKAFAKAGVDIAFRKSGRVLARAAAPILLKIGLLLLIFASILLLFAMCVSLFNSSAGHVLEAISYTADADDITGASVHMTQLEVELKESIVEAASDLGGLHEFRLVISKPGGGGADMAFEGTLVAPGRGHPYYEAPVYDPPDFDPLALLPYLSAICHDPFEVMAYLTALCGDFKGHDIEDILREIFDAAFSLEITESIEVRTAAVEAWHYETQDLGGMQDLGGYVDGAWVPDWQWVSDWQEVRVGPFEEDMEYEWHCREVALTINSTIGDVLLGRMDDEQQEQYILIMESLGLRQFVGSPFGDNWLGSVSSIYGYRFHPTTLEREMHAGIDIARPEGTPVMCGAQGTVAFAGDKGSYGNTVIVEYIDAESGLGVRLLYAHLAAVDVSTGDSPAAGDVIGTVGQTGTATGPHLHMEISIKENGGEWRTIDPIFFTEPYPS